MLISSHFSCRDDRTKSFRYYEMTIPNYLPDSFKRFFRLNRETVEFLCQSLEGCPELAVRPIPGGRPQIPLHKKVLMTLRYLASQQQVRELSDHFGVTDHSFLRCKRQVVRAVMNHLLTKVITWPESAELREISTRFDEQGAHNFPNIIGAVDGSHIQIHPPEQNPNSYYNRKKFHSIVLQAVCVDDLKFTDINVGWPGRVHDAKVLKNSSLYETGFEKSEHGRYHVLGDGAYPLKHWLLTPYRDNGHLTHRQARYNVALSSKRQVIERAFGMLKGRFKRLKFIHMKSVEEICQTIVCACILHNICICRGDDLEEMINDEQPAAVARHPRVVLLPNDAQGLLKRVLITNRM
jgi:hypothetical protein